MAPIARPMVPRHGEYTPLFNSVEAMTSDASLTAVAPDTPSDDGAEPHKKTASPHTNSNNTPLLKGVWTPPSQNKSQRRGNVFSIEQPEDLLDFIIEDERLSVVKVYATWCKTCKVFDMRYRKVASQFGDKYDDKTGTEITQMGRARFAEMQYDDPNNKEICLTLNLAPKLPYILMYKGSQGKVKEFQCLPAKIQMLANAVNELADPVEEEGVVANENDGGEINGKLDKPYDLSAS
ncbi:hypothetical protein ACHAXR_001318, partial [Thalassiosira sp. AJA248-18]